MALTTPQEKLLLFLVIQDYLNYMALTQEQVTKFRKKYGIESQAGAKQTSDESLTEWKRNIAAKAGIGLPDEPEVDTVAGQNIVEPSDVEAKPKTSLLEKTTNVLDKTIGKLADKLFGSTKEAVGGLLIGSMGSAMALSDDPETKRQGEILEKRGEEGITPTNIGFAALETLPGGSGAKILKRLPGGKFVLDVSSKAFKKLSTGLKTKAVKLYTEALSPTTKATKRRAERIVPGLIKAKERGSLKLLQKKAGKKLATAGGQIETLVAKIGKNKVETKGILETLEKSKEKYIVDGVVVNKNAIKAIDEIGAVVAEFGEETTAENLVNLRRVWDEAIASRKGFEKFSDEITAFSLKAQKEGAGAIREALSKTSPELAEVNKTFSFWKNVDDVVSSTLERTAGQSGKLRQRFGQGVGALGGLSGGAPGVIGGAILGDAVMKVVGSAAYKTSSAVMKDRLANALVNGTKDDIIRSLRAFFVLSKNTLDQLSEK